MIDIAMLRTGVPVRDHGGRRIAVVDSIRDGLVRLNDIAEWSPRSPYLTLNEVERSDDAGLHLKAPPGAERSQ